jgi:phosphoribosylamine-glycine ligase
MFGLYGPGSARDHACMLRLVKENDGRDVRFYHCGANAVLSREPWCVVVPGNSPAEAAKLAREDGTKFVLITDSELLLAGAADAFRQEGMTVLGPDRHASQVEGSKALMTALVQESAIPGPESWVVTSAKDAKTFLRNHWSRQDQFVIKTDRLIHDGKHRSMVPDSLGEGLEDVDEELAALFVVAEGRNVTEGVGALREGGLAVAGGRVAAPIANAKTIEDVKQQVYGTLSRIRFEGKHHRSDLGYGIAEGLFS